MKRIFVAAFVLSLLPVAPAAAQTRGLPVLPYLHGTPARVPAAPLLTAMPLSVAIGPMAAVVAPQLSAGISVLPAPAALPETPRAAPSKRLEAMAAIIKPDLETLQARELVGEQARGLAERVMAPVIGKTAAASADAGMRPTNPWEDARVGRAVETLSRSPIGRDIYAAVYRDYGTSLRVRIDDAANASYDARLSWENGAPVLYLTESLLRRSEAVIGAYMVRELADAYYRSFPASAERGFLSYAAMVQTYAETARAWEPDVQRYFESWRDAVKGVDEGRYASLPDSPFFRDFLTTIDDSNTESRAKLTLGEQYRRGMITYGDYHNYQSYITTLRRSHADWLSSKGY